MSKSEKIAREFVCYNVDVKGQCENVRTTTTVTQLVMSALTAHVCVCVSCTLIYINGRWIASMAYCFIIILSTSFAVRNIAYIVLYCFCQDLNAIFFSFSFN